MTDTDNNTPQKIPKAAVTRRINETNAMIRGLVEVETLDYPFWISGTVSRKYISELGHVYITLEDSGYAIRCMIRQSAYDNLNNPVENGMTINAYGKIRVYDKDARITFQIEKFKPVTSSFVPDQNVLEYLRKEGLYPRDKIPLPDQINRIALVTGRRSEAKYDFENAYRSAGGTAMIILNDVHLQTESAAQQIANALRRANHERQANVIAIARGGGREADLATFNSREIAEEICRSKIPIITGIGHQQDTTLADLLADYAAMTPTEAGYYLGENTRLAENRDSGQIPPWKLPVIQWLLIASVGVLLLILATLLLGRNFITN